MDGSTVVLPAHSLATASPAPALAAAEPSGTAAGRAVFTVDGLRPQRQRLSTGVARLDTLLGGGYVPGTAALLYGPPFCGKQVLQQLAFVQAAIAGQPSVYLLHGVGAEAMSRRLRGMDPRFAAAEEAGHVTYVDAHSHFLGENTGYPHTVYVQDPQDVARLLEATQSVRLDRSDTIPLLAIQSASTLLLDLGPTRAFHFLRTVVGRALRAGGVGLLSVQAGMHPEADVQMAKHLCSGMIEMRKKNGMHCLQVEGLETALPSPGWVEYQFTPTTLRVTGSFASRSIR